MPATINCLGPKGELLTSRWALACITTTNVSGIVVDPSLSIRKIEEDSCLPCAISDNM
jgi:hypothetical protein